MMEDKSTSSKKTEPKDDSKVEEGAIKDLTSALKRLANR